MTAWRAQPNNFTWNASVGGLELEVFSGEALCFWSVRLGHRLPLAGGNADAREAAQSAAETWARELAEGVMSGLGETTPASPEPDDSGVLAGRPRRYRGAH